MFRFCTPQLSISQTLICLSIIIFFPFNAFADEAKPATSSSSPFQLPISKGNYSLGGNFSSSRYPDAGWYFNLESNVEYFLADRLSVGGTVGMYWSSGYGYTTSQSIGPSFTWYFADFERSAFFLSQSITYSNRHSANDGDYAPMAIDESILRGATSIGFSYFITPNVAFTPKMTMTYARDQAITPSVSGGFSVFF